MSFGSSEPTDDNTRDLTEPSTLNSRLDLALLAYLVLPLVVAVVGTFRPLVAFALVGLIAIGTWPAVRSHRGLGRTAFPWKALILAGIPAVVVAMFFTNGFWFWLNEDWLKHQAIFSDLTRYPWPVTFFEHNGDDYVFRYYAAYYVVPAALAKVFGHVHEFTTAWTALGLVLVAVRLAAPARRGVAQLLIAISLFFFGGLGFIGWVLSGRLGELNWTQHQGHWAEILSYQDFSSDLAWTPQHWIGAAVGAVLLFDRSKNDRGFYNALPLLLVAVFFWSSFAAIGLIPLALVPVIRILRSRDGWKRLTHPAIPAGLIVALPIGVFLTADAGNIPSGWIWESIHWDEIQGQLPLFLLLHVVAIPATMKLAGIRLGALGWTAVAVLAAIPFYTVGLFNDLCMRASIPAFVVLFIILRNHIVSNEDSLFRRRPRARTIPLIIVLLLGSITAFPEYIRAVAKPSDPKEFYGHSQILTYSSVPPGDFFSQYVAHQPTWINALLRKNEPIAQPSVVEPNAELRWEAGCSGCEPTAVPSGNPKGAEIEVGPGVTIIHTPYALPMGVYNVQFQMKIDNVASSEIAVVLQPQDVQIKEDPTPDNVYTIDETITVPLYSPIDTHLGINVAVDAETTVRISGLTIQHLDTITNPPEMWTGQERN